VAPTERAAVNLTVHVPVPEHAPVHPVNLTLPVVFAESVTCWPLAYMAEQADPQLMPAGELVTVPVLVPVFVTVRTKVGLNVAVTLVVALTVTTQVELVPEQAPLQPLKADPSGALAFNVTC
jgi:hypothetical protein